MNAKLFWLAVGSIIYTYAGYPAILTLLARLRPRPRPFPPLEPEPSLTLLIVAYNEQEVIARKLENSLALDYPREKLQILVVADGSDQTPDIVRTYANQGVELDYRAERRGKMAAINRAIPLVRGELVVFSDANNLYEPGGLRHLVAPFADPTVGAVTGTKVITTGGQKDALGTSEGLYWKYESFIKEQETRLGCCTGVLGEMLAVRRSLLEPAPESVINDDFYIAMRLTRRGYRVVYAPLARSFEAVSASAQDERTRRARIVAGRYQAIALAPTFLPFNRPLLIWQVGSHKFLRPLVPLAMVAALLTNLFAVLRPAQARTTAHPLWNLAPPFNWLVLLLQVGFYALAWLGGRKKYGGVVGKVLYLPTFLVHSNLATLAGLYRFLTKRQNALWERVQRRMS
ncbi:MAG: glycosyltransferase family 2 protein [Chloroflexaceae bacterium]|nr:glycosyltransferase family 2 protein [Chloroflexaceae bacterium]